MVTLGAGNICKYTEGAFRVGVTNCRRRFRIAGTWRERDLGFINKENDPNICRQKTPVRPDRLQRLDSREASPNLAAEVENVLNDIRTTHGNGQWKDKGNGE